jgi:sortase (surface protein transpeptidase)
MTLALLLAGTAGCGASRHAATLGTAPVRPGAVAPAVLRIPSLGIDTRLERLGLDKAGALQPPADPQEAGWFAAGPAPGEVGPAVIAGHVDSKHGPAVFYRLAQLRAGDRILVDRNDGTTVAFRVRSVQTYPKAAFPTAEVYGPTPEAALRLITCGGTFDRSRQSYEDNVVAYAAMEV